MTLFLLMSHQADKDSGQEHENKGLQNSHENFEECDQNRANAADDGDAADGKYAQASLDGHRTEHRQGDQKRVTSDHVGKEPNRQGCGLYKEAEKFNNEDDRNDEPKKN